ncbi:MAG: hypothetical protein OEW58_10110 [Gammaproteobacteria bacterium]|nr:hypothetical protein [Gammaproteobacteria bacterium]
MKLTHLAICASLIATPCAYAENTNPDFSYGKADAYQRVSQAVDSLSQWADGEYQEHELEGLFQRYPQDALVIKSTLDLVNQLKQQATQAQADGDQTRASALLFAAEATALYAANMPHLLEKRLDVQAQAAR